MFGTTTTQRLRIEPNKAEVLKFIRETDYPHKMWIENPWILEDIIVGRVTDEYGTVGFIWGHWQDYRVLTVHVGVLPGASLDWRGIMPQLLFAAYFLGADEIVLPFDHSPRAEALGRLVQSLGFVPYPDNPYGHTTCYRRSTYGQDPETTQAA